MATALRLGQSEAGPVSLDLEVLLETRLLVTATSGGGKSGVLYQICEQAVPHVPVIVIDPEGEFAPLRAKCPFVLASPEGEAPATVKTAGLLAHRLLELGASAICDLYELQVKDRHEFVRDFLMAMVDAPKHLWRPVIVIVDEAHLFVPEKGQGESVATEAVTAMATRGRKRGYALVLATQRLAMISKTVAGMCQNVLLGRASQIDQVRAAATLQITGKAEKDEFWKIITRTRTGEFFAYGMAFHTEVPERFQVDRAVTLPEKKDRLALQAPPPLAEIAAFLPKLADLPQEAERREKTVEELQKALREARQEIARLTAANVQGDVMALADDVKAMEEELERLRPLQGKMDDLLAKVFGIGSALAQASTALLTVQERFDALVGERQGVVEMRGDEVLLPALPPHRTPSTTPLASFTPPDGSRKKPARSQGSPAERILGALAQLRSGGIANPVRMHVCLLSGYGNLTSTGFVKALGALRTAGLIDYPEGGKVTLTPEGVKKAPKVEPILSDEALHESIYATLGGPETKILRYVIHHAPKAVRRDAVMSAAGYSNSTSTGFVKALGRLRTLGYIDYPKGGEVVATAQCFLSRGEGV